MNSGNPTSDTTSVPKWSTRGFTTGDKGAIQFIYPPYQYAEAVQVSGGGYDHVKITWSPSSFCVPSLNIKIFDGSNVIVKQATSIDNNGIYEVFSTIGLSTGITYEVTISNPNDPTDQLYDTFELQ